MRSKAHSALTVPLVLHHTRIYKRAMKKIIFNSQRRNKHFLIVIYHSSLVKGDMNAVRLCKLRNGVKSDTSFNKDLSNEPNFDWIHLGGQYL
jgi:hypothetical protein